MTRAPEPRSERGFTLVEVLVASVILAIALLALSSLFALGLKNNAVAKEDTVMAALVQDKLESLRRQPRAELELHFSSSPACQGSCEFNCECGDPPPCDPTDCCTNLCYPNDCPTGQYVVRKTQNPISDPNPSDDIRESLYVRRWSVEKVNIGEPVGCVFKLTVTVGSRKGIFAPTPPPPASNWLEAAANDVVSDVNPRRVQAATYRR